MNEHDKTSSGIPHDEGASTTGTGRTWETGAQEGFSSAEPPESEARIGASENAETAEEKSAVLAGIMSVIPGVGHFYLGWVQRGLFFLVAFILLIFALNTRDLRPLHPLFGLMQPFLLVYGVVDAVRGARTINRAAVAGRPAPEPGIPFLSDTEDSAGRVPGWVFIALGVVLLGVTRFGWDMNWLIDWWPVVLIVIGVRMITRDRKSG